MTTLPLKLHKNFARGLRGKWAHFMMMRKSDFLNAQINDWHIIEFLLWIKINFWLLIAINYFLLSFLKCGKLFGTYNCLCDVNFFKIDEILQNGWKQWAGTDNGKGQMVSVSLQGQTDTSELVGASITRT